MQHVFQPVRGMGIIHNHRIGLPCLYQLEPAGYTGKTVQHLFDLPFIDLFCQQGANGAHNIIYVELSGNVQAQVHVPRRGVEAQMHTLGPHFIGQGVNMVFLPHAVSQVRGTGPGFNYFAGRLVRVEHRGLIGLIPIRQVFEEEALGIPVGLHGLMEIQMVLRNVGKHRRVELNAGHPFQGQGVGGYFHHHILAAPFLHAV